MTPKAIEAVVPLSMTETEQRVREALGANGFGVLTEIDVAATLQAKLGVERAPLKILGACNPTLAERALRAHPDAALLLPCNVVLESDPAGTRVRAVDPRVLLDDPALYDLAEEAADKLAAAVATVVAD